MPSETKRDPAHPGPTPRAPSPRPMKDTAQQRRGATSNTCGVSRIKSSMSPRRTSRRSAEPVSVRGGSDVHVLENVADIDGVDGNLAGWERSSSRLRELPRRS
jgi:hypothetical protein